LQAYCKGSKFANENYFLLEIYSATKLLFSIPLFCIVFDPKVTTVLIFFIGGAYQLFICCIRRTGSFFHLLTKTSIFFKKQKQQPSYKRKLLIYLKKSKKLLLGSLTVANVFANIAIIIISNIILDDVFSIEKMKLIWLALLIKIVVITALILLFCEIIPKLYANSNNIRFAQSTGIAVEAVYYTCKRIAGWLLKYSSIIEKICKNFCQQLFP